MQLIALVLLALVLSATCTVVRASESDDDDADEPHQLVLIGVSGLTSRAFSPAYMPFAFGQASERGAYTTHMRTISSHFETPAWISLLYGATPEEYGCEADDRCDLPADVQSYRSLFDVLEYDYGYSVALFSEHNGLSSRNPISEAVRKQRPVSYFSSGTLDMLRRAQDERHLPQTDQRVLFFHFTGADRMGHSMGYDGEMYHAEVQCLDWQIQMLCDSLWEYEPERTTFVLMAEHGGTGYEHDTFDIHTVQVPFAMWGYGVNGGGMNLDRRATTTPQVAPTIAYALDIDIPEEWVHIPITQLRSYQGSCKHSEMVHSWNETYDGGLCPVPQGWSHHQAERINDLLIFFTFFMYTAIGITWFLADLYPKSLRLRHHQ